MKRYFWTLTLVTVLLSACYTQKVMTGAGASTTIANKADKRWNLYFFGGIVGQGRTTVQCPSGNATVVTQQTVGTSLIKGFTFGLIAPTVSTTYCEAGVVPTAAK